MKAQDTVMGVNQVGDMIGTFDPILFEVLKAQAEISFKAGKREGHLEGLSAGVVQGKVIGIREVVEWLRRYPRIIDELRDELPNQLKEWGING